MTWHVYIIECNDGSFYTGITNDLDKRITAHNGGHGAKYTKSRRPVHLRYSEPASDRGQASQREYAIKSGKFTAILNIIIIGAKIPREKVTAPLCDINWFLRPN